MARWRAQGHIEFPTVASRDAVLAALQAALAMHTRVGERISIQGLPNRPRMLIFDVRFPGGEVPARLIFDAMRVRLGGLMRGLVSLHFCPEEDQPPWHCRLNPLARYEEVVV